MMTVIASADELGGNQTIKQLIEGGEGRERRLPLRIELLQPVAFGLPVRASLRVLPCGQFAKETRADVLAHDAAVHLMAAGVVATATAARLPAHGVV
jgi:hypothetical protein